MGAGRRIGSTSPVLHLHGWRLQLLEERIPTLPTGYTPYYYHFNGLGSVVGLADSTGNHPASGRPAYGLVQTCQTAPRAVCMELCIHAWATARCSPAKNTLACPLSSLTGSHNAAW